MLDEDVHVLGSHYLTNVAYHEVKKTLFVAAGSIQRNTRKTSGNLGPTTNGWTTDLI